MTDRMMTSERYKAPAIIIEDDGIVCRCWKLIVCEIDCIVGIELTKMFVSSIPESSFVYVDRMAYAFDTD